MNLDDCNLVKQARAGKQQAFTLLVRKYEAAVYAIAYRWTHNAADAQDLAQECFARAFERLDRLQKPEKFAGWLRTTAVNVCRMWRRKRERAAGLVDEKVMMPPVRVVDKNALAEFGYAIHFHEALVGEGQLPDAAVFILPTNRLVFSINQNSI